MMVSRETVCGPVCQHPACWDAQRRKSRVPRRVKKKPKSKHHLEHSFDKDILDAGELPKQNVLNLLDDFGSDPNDRFPSKFNGRPAHERTKSIVSAIEMQSQASMVHRTRTITRESSRKDLAPRATPASPQLHRATHADGKAKYSMARMEVQEVFEFEELNRNWNETFEKKQYYVWVPNPKKTNKRVSSITEEHAINRVGMQNKVSVRDITEDLVPEEVQHARESTVLFDDVWPMYKRPPAAVSRGSARYLNPSSDLTTQRIGQDDDQYYGIYEMLDLPREVLADILNHVEEKDMMNRERFARALVTALPTLQRNSKAVSLASSDILQQKPMPLLDGKMRQPRQMSDALGSRPIFYMDDHLIDEMSEANTPQPAEMSALNCNEQQYEMSQYSPLNDKKPLPPITDRFQKVRRISVGLPEIPSGVKYTRPFRYTGVSHDFSLGPVPTPPGSTARSARNSPNAGSTLLVTVPSVLSEDETQMNAYSYYERSSWATDETNGFNTSQFTTGQPDAPVNTPHTFLTESPSPDKYRASRSEVARVEAMRLETLHQEEMCHEALRQAISPGAPLPPVNTPAGPAVTELTSMSLVDATGADLDTITERDQPTTADTTQDRADDQGPPPRSSKSVRFITEVPTSEEQSDLDPDMMSCVASRKTDASMSVNVTTNVAADKVSKPSGSRDVTAPPSRGLTQTTSMNTMSPEPWPLVNEEEYNKTPSPVQATARTSASSIRDAESMTVNVDMRSEKTSLSSMLPRSGITSRDGLQSRDSLPARSSLSRESTKHSEKAAKLMHEPVIDSPGPPPPSPEPKNHIFPGEQEEELSKENSALDDILETDSEFTISARPPSNLEDSTCNTPNPTARNNSFGKHSQLAQYLGHRGHEKSMDATEALHEESGELITQIGKEMTNTTIPSDSVTLADTESVGTEHYGPTPSGVTSVTVRREGSLVDAKSLEKNVNLTNKTSKSNSIARAPPVRRLSDSNTVAKSSPTQSRENQALDLVPNNNTTTTNNQSNRAAQLDTFDSTDESYKQELKAEFEKLNSKSNTEPKPDRRDSL